jgi:hypothetical protein
VREQRESQQTTAGFLRAALSTMAADSPDRYSDLVRYLHEAAGSYRVDDETFTVVVVDGEVAVGEALGSGLRPVRLDTTADALISLVDGTSKLTELLSSEDLIIHANPDALLNLDAAVRAFSLTAIESSKIRELFEDYRDWIYRHRSNDLNS